MFIFILISITFLSFIAFAQEQCQLAAPIFGVVKCDSASAEQYDYPQYELQSSGVSSITDLPCVSQCKIESKASIKDPQGKSLLDSGSNFCGAYEQLNLKIMDGQNVLWERPFGGGTDIGNFPIEFTYGKTIQVVGQCKIPFSEPHPLNAGAKVEVAIRKIYLYENPDNTTNFVQVLGSSGCVPNDFVQKYFQKKIISGQLPSTYYDNPNIEKNLNSDFKPVEEIENSFSNNPKNLHAGETYTFLSGWKIIPDIGVIYNKDNLPSGYCGGGAPGNRKLYSFSKVTTASGQCYEIPTSAKSDVECCYNEDCNWKDPTGRLLCDPNTFSCTDKKPCNSDIDCQAPGQAVCVDKIETTWSCDLSQKVWSNFNGTCVKSNKQVQCCSDSECGSTEYCNREEGCKSRYLLLQCPTGSCCKEGSNYEPKECPSGQQCCLTESNLVGSCKDNCQTNPIGGQELQNSSDQQKELYATGSTIQFNPALLIAILVLVGIGTAYYIFTQKGAPAVHINQTQNTVKFCNKCGNTVYLNAKYCTKCGNHLNK